MKLSFLPERWQDACTVQKRSIYNKNLILWSSCMQKHVDFIPWYSKSFGFHSHTFKILRSFFDIWRLRPSLREAMRDSRRCWRLQHMHTKYWEVRILHSDFEMGSLRTQCRPSFRRPTSISSLLKTAEAAANAHQRLESQNLSSLLPRAWILSYT